jgi:hypothetical protein
MPYAPEEANRTYERMNGSTVRSTDGTKYAASHNISLVFPPLEAV